MRQTPKPNLFPTLSEALEAEGLLGAWDGSPIAYNQTLGQTYNDGTKYGHYISVYRTETGLYERPVHYKRG